MGPTHGRMAYRCALVAAAVLAVSGLSAGMPSSLSAAAAGSRAYVTNNVDNTVSVIDMATNTVTATIAVGSNPGEVAVSADGSHAYVTNYGGGTVSVIDTSTNTVTATITVGSYPVSVAIGTPPAVSTPTTAGHQARATVCTTTPQPRVGEQAGRFLSVTVAAWKAGITDPTSALYNATPAIYVAGYGTMCGLSELATYGGNPANFTDSGTTVDETGTPTHAGADPSNGPSYEYYTLRH
jgi:YVTN family beta-propeller protein